jgi:hypothetical protein
MIHKLMGTEIHIYIYIYIYEIMAEVSQTIFNLTLEIMIIYFSHWKVVRNVVMIWSIVQIFVSKQINFNIASNQTDKAVSLHLTVLLTWQLLCEYYTSLLYRYS